MVTRFHLGGPHAKRRSEDSLRGGEIVFESPRGLARSQALLVDALPKKPVGRILTGMDTEGAVALAAGALHPGAEVRWFHFDLYVARKVARVLADNLRSDLRADALEDAPEGPFDLAALAFPSGGEALLARDLIEAAHDALVPGGRLVAATDGGGAWLRMVVEKVFGKARPGGSSRKGTVVLAERRREKPARSDRSHVLRPSIERVRGGGTVEFELETRPGTFSHGSLDRGTKALLERFDPGSDRTFLDLGAGCGAIGLWAARAAPESRVVMVESNVRAIGCALRNVQRNDLVGRADVAARADLEDLPPAPGAGAGGGFDACLANPPYFGDFRIATAFVRAAHGALHEGGRIALVVRSGAAADNHAKVVADVFGQVEVDSDGDYAIVTSRR